MPTRQNETKPQRVHGIVPTPFEIPPEHLPPRRPESDGRPFLISVAAVYFLIRAVVFLLLALVPWGDPDSGIAKALIANPGFAFSMIPRAFRPAPVIAGQAPGADAQMLPFIFLALGIICGVLAFKLWTLSARWRWATMFWSTWALASNVRLILIDLALRSAIKSEMGVAFPPMPAELQLFLFSSIVWNLLIICYLGFYPGVKQAFERNE